MQSLTPEAGKFACCQACPRRSVQKSLELQAVRRFTDRSAAMLRTSHYAASCRAIEVPLAGRCAPATASRAQMLLSSFAPKRAYSVGEVSDLSHPPMPLDMCRDAPIPSHSCHCAYGERYMFSIALKNKPFLSDTASATVVAALGELSRAAAAPLRFSS